MENKLYGHIKSFFIHIIYFQTNYSNLCRLFWRIWYVCGNNGPLPNVTFSALYFKDSLLNWRLKFMEMTECLQNCRFHRTFNSNYSSEVKQKLIEKLDISRLFYSWLTLRKRHIMRLLRLVISLLTKTFITYLKMVNIMYSNLLCNLKIKKPIYIISFHDHSNLLLYLKGKRYSWKWKCPDNMESTRKWYNRTYCSFW